MKEIASYAASLRRILSTGLIYLNTGSTVERILHQQLDVHAARLPHTAYSGYTAGTRYAHGALCAVLPEWLFEMTFTFRRINMHTLSKLTVAAALSMLCLSAAAQHTPADMDARMKQMMKMMMERMSMTEPARPGSSVNP